MFSRLGSVKEITPQGLGVWASWRHRDGLVNVNPGETRKYGQNLQLSTDLEHNDSTPICIHDPHTVMFSIEMKTFYGEKA
jgi:hypothetical protein